MARYKIKRRGANLNVGLQAKRRSFRRRGKTAMKKARRMLRRKPTIATPVSYTTRVQLVTTNGTSVNVNNPANPVNAVSYSIYNIRPNAIADLTARSVIYSKFKITKIKYHFKRVSPNKNIAGINYMTIGPQADYHAAFPNTFNRLLPQPTETNAQAIAYWAAQQTHSKKINITTGNWSKSVQPYVVENTTLQGPSGVTLGADVQVQRNRKMPWLDLNSDLLDNMSLGQLVLVLAPTQVLTSFPLGTGGAGANGMSQAQAQSLATWDCYADVTYMVKGRFLDREIATG